MRNDASLNLENGKRKRRGDGYEMFREEKPGDLVMDYTCGLNKKGNAALCPDVLLE